MLSFIVNQELVETDAHPGTSLLEFIRDVRCLAGTKEACHEGECGACTVLVGARGADGGVSYKAVASCLLPIGDVAGCHVVTIEGLGGEDLTLIQRLFVEKSASQCGFCTPGFVLALAGFALTSPDLSEADAIDAMDGNLCRCTGYVAIRNAARALVERLAAIRREPGERVAALVAAGVLPAAFVEIPGRLAALPAPEESRSEAAVLVAGGTDLFVQQPDRLMESELRFLSRRRDLDYVRVERETLRVGGAVTLEDFRRAPEVKEHFPVLEQDLLLHSSAILRNKATLTGNIVNASPIGDMTIILLALDATLVITTSGGESRRVSLDRFFQGYKKFDLGPGEIVTEIIIPFLADGARYHFEKVSNRVILDIAAVNSAIRVTLAPDAGAPGGRLDDLRIAAGGVAPIPLLVGGLERFRGKTADAATIAEIARFVMEAATPIDDVRGSAEYKKKLLGQLVRAHFAAMAKEAVR